MQTARLRTILLLLAPALSSLCLGAGYLPSAAWAAAVSLATFLLWMAARRWKAFWTATLGLSAATAAAAYGLVNGAALLWMLPGAALALAAWDLALLDARLENNPAPTAPLEQAHYTSLGLAMGGALLAAAVGQMIRFQIPFIVMLALVVLAYVGMERLVREMRE